MPGAANEQIVCSVPSPCAKKDGAVEVGEAYKVSCAEDVKRVCRGVDAEDGSLLACLQMREQELSLGCYQSLPKGQIRLRN